MNYKQLKNKTYKNYKKIKRVYCPYLKKDVIFNSQGFWHLIYTGRNEKRDQKNQILRFQLLPKAVQLLSLTTTLQEFENRKEIKTCYYGFIAILKDWKMKIVVKNSVIPNWVTNVKRDRRLCKGDMERD